MLCKQERAENLAFHRAMRRCEVERGEQFVGALDIGCGADDVVQSPRPLKQSNDLGFPRDVHRDRLQSGLDIEAFACAVQLFFAAPDDNDLCAVVETTPGECQPHSRIAADDENP